MAHVPVGSALITPNTNFYESYGTDIIQPYISDEAKPRLYFFNSNFYKTIYENNILQFKIIYDNNTIFSTRKCCFWTGLRCTQN